MRLAWVTTAVFAFVAFPTMAGADGKDDRIRELEAEVRSLRERLEGDDGAIRALRKALASDDWGTRLAAADALVREGRTEVALAALLGWGASSAPDWVWRQVDAIVDDALRDALEADDAAVLDILGPARGSWLGSQAFRRLVPRIRNPEIPERYGVRALMDATRAYPCDTLSGIRRSAETHRRLLTQLIDHELAGSSAEDAVAFLRDVSGLPWMCLPAGADGTVRAASRQTPLWDAASSALRTAGLSFRLLDGFPVAGTTEELKPVEKPDMLLSLPRREEDRATREKLLSPVSILADGDSLRDVLDHWHRGSAANFVLLDREGAQVTLDVDHVPAVTAFRLLALLSGVRGEVRWGAVVIGTPAALAKLGPPAGEMADTTAASRALLGRLRARRVNLCLQSVQLEDVAWTCAVVAEATIELKIDLDMRYERVRVAASDVSVEDALRLVLRPLGLTFEVREGIVVIVPRL